ncbi:hypothetical protein, partial [Enterococcus faecalis]
TRSNQKNHGLHGTDTSQSTRNDSLDYDEIVGTCFQHFPNITLKEIERMTPYEFNLRIKAVNLRAINEERKLYVNALATRIFTTPDEKGQRYIFNEVKDVYDFEKLERDVRGEISQREVEKLSELEENARRLEQARKIVEERRKQRDTK